MDSLYDMLSVIEHNAIQTILTTAFIIGAVLFGLISRKVTKNYAIKHNMARSREIYIRKLINIGVFVVLVISIGAVWEVSLKGLSIYFASIFTIVGVALFASWSILSNVTASIMLFFFFPYRIGGRIKIMDGDNSIEGEIMDITLFYVKIKMDDTVILYPNSQVMLKPVVHFE